MKYILGLLILCSPCLALASDDDDAQAALAIAIASRKKDVPKDTPKVEDTGYHLEQGLDGRWYTLPNGHTFLHNLKGGQSYSPPFPQGGITPPTIAPSAGGVSTQSGVGIRTVHTTTDACSTGRYGVTSG